MTSTITVLENQVSSLNSNIGILIQTERNLKRTSKLFDGMIEVEGMKDMKIASEKVSYSKKKTDVLKLDHMLQNCDRRVGSHHRKRKKQPLICHYYGKYRHTKPYLFEWLKLNIKGSNKFHAKMKWNPNTTSTSSIEHKGSLSKSWYFNS